MQEQVGLAEELETRPDAIARLAQSLGDGTHLTPVGSEHGDDDIGLPEFRVLEDDAALVIGLRHSRTS